MLKVPVLITSRCLFDIVAVVLAKLAKEARYHLHLFANWTNCEISCYLALANVPFNGFTVCCLRDA
jgi:hypothetical protein